MRKHMSIYTKTGDSGNTSLFGGKRVLKCEELVDVYGSIDELNSWIGLLCSHIEAYDVQEFLLQIQEDLFVISSSIAGSKMSFKGLKKRVKEMEERIDVMQSELPKITHFIIPGGVKLGAMVHITRSICRRVERQMVSYNETNKVDKSILQYLNRLSDLLFLLAQFINKQSGKIEKVWIGQKNKNKK